VRKNVIAWAALILAVLSLALNAIALGTISEQQSTIRGLEAQVGGLVTFQDVAMRTDREIANVLEELKWQVVSIQAIQNMHEQALGDLVQNDAGITDILSGLVSLAEQGH